MSLEPLSKEKQRWINLFFFFLSGIVTATWASRIPDVQNKLGLNDAQWGVVLFSLPLGLVTAMPLSSWVIAKYGARKIMVLSSLLFAAILFLLPLFQDIWMLAIVLFFFGLLRSGTNLSINTYSIEVQKLYERPIIATFHGIWSLACLLAAGTGTVMIAAGIIPKWHFLIVALISISLCIFYWGISKNSHAEKMERRPFFIRPTRYLFLLGLVALCSMICEGTMFDWGVNYFRKVVHAKEEWSTAGYTAFTIAMVAGRLIGERVIAFYGPVRMLIINGFLMATGFFLAILFPYFLPACIGFLLVGLGDSVLVPMIFSLAGKSKDMPPAYAIASVTIIGYSGFMAGPLIVGSISEAAGMRWAFALMGVLSMAIMGITIFIRKHHRKDEE